jgi:enoyl-CoA hydratase/carnithine racemase
METSGRPLGLQVNDEAPEPPQVGIPSMASDHIYNDAKYLLMNLLNIEVPIIAAVNGPALIHAELAVLCDIVIASPNAAFQDAPHFPNRVVPGDGADLKDAKALLDELST